MSNPKPKLIDLDFSGAAERHGSSPIIPMPSLTPESGAATEVRLLVDQLQQAAWDARARLRSMEEERNSLATRLQEAQNAQLELRSRLNGANAAGPEVDSALREAQVSARAANENHSRALAAEKTAAELQKQCDDLARQRDEFRRAYEGASRSNGNTSHDYAAQLFNLRQARDTSQAQSRALADKLAAAEEELVTLQEKLEANASGSQDHSAELNAARETSSRLEAELVAARQAAETAAGALAQAQSEVASLQKQREEVLQQFEIVSGEIAVVRVDLEARGAEFAKVTERAEEATRRCSELEATADSLRAAQDTANTERVDLQARLAAAEAQAQEFATEREVLQQSIEERAAEINALRTQLSDQERSSAEALEQAQLDNRDQAQRLQAQRLQTIDLVTRLEASQLEIKTISAHLAEARLIAKASGARLEAHKEAAVLNSRVAPPEAAEPSKPLIAFDTRRALDAVRAILRSYQAFSKDQEDLSHLNELYSHIDGIAEQAAASGLPGLLRILCAYSTFVQELYQYPEQITADTLKTIHETQEFLSAIIKPENLPQLESSSSSSVYIVEDDELTCECITMVLEAALMRGVSSVDPLKAACELAATPCDLILLDIRMPGMDGFELCSEIRTLALHRDTPVMFISGDASPENRARGTMVGGCDFLSKPFMLCELTLKAFVHIAKAQFHLA
jgi:CheY-like chemotaxis protein